MLTTKQMNPMTHYDQTYYENVMKRVGLAAAEEYRLKVTAPKAKTIDIGKGESMQSLLAQEAIDAERLADGKREDQSSRVNNGTSVDIGASIDITSMPNWQLEGWIGGLDWVANEGWEDAVDDSPTWDDEPTTGEQTPMWPVPGEQSPLPTDGDGSWPHISDDGDEGETDEGKKDDDSWDDEGEAVIPPYNQLKAMLKANDIDFERTITKEKAIELAQQHWLL